MSHTSTHNWDLNELSENSLQILVHKILSDPSDIKFTKSSKRLQFLSPGRINPHEGPDFLDIAVLLDGYVVIGDAEFHKNSSDWISHKHSGDERYNNVIIHIVINDNAEISSKSFETLIISVEQIAEHKNKAIDEISTGETVNTLEELQHYALLRLLRKTSEAQKLINNFGYENALKTLTAEFVDKYSKKRTRHVYSSETLKTFSREIFSSSVGTFISDISSGNSIHIPDRMHSLIKHSLLGEGAHFRRELILNCILPVAVCLADEEARINLFLWYWSTPALHSYGVLRRKFNDIPQNFIWQQQGMLEYIKEHGRRSNIVAEAIKDYGFAEVLSFYRLGRSPFAIEQED